MEILSRSKPRSAWLLFGDKESFCEGKELRALWEEIRQKEDVLWTCSPQVEFGDLLFIYFIRPHKAIHLVARAASSPFVDEEICVNSLKPVTSRQWWVALTPPVAVRPISYRDICEAVGEAIILKGKSGKYIPPDAANRLLRLCNVIQAKSPSHIESTLQKVVGRSELPDPKIISFKTFRDIPAGELRVEREVERYLAEPLLKMIQSRHRGLSYKKRFKIGRKVADYVLMKNNRPVCVLEVKLRLVAARDRKSWKTSLHYKQAAEYASQLGTGIALMDCEDIYLFLPKGDRPIHKIRRRSMTRNDLAILSKHFMA